MIAANKAVRGHLSHRNNQGTNTQIKATAGKTKMPQNTAHSSWSSWPPLSNSIGDIMAIDTPKQVNATLTSVNTPSPSFMSDALRMRRMRLIGEKNIRRRMVADHTTPSVLKDDRVGCARRDRQPG